MPDILDAVSVNGHAEADWTGAQLALEAAIRGGFQDPQAYYMLALCHKRLGRHAEARHCLNKIAEPDANVLFQRGILALTDRDYVEAAENFARALAIQPESYQCAYNLLLARLHLGQREPCLSLITRFLPLARQYDEERSFVLLRALLVSAPGAASPALQSDPGAPAEHRALLAGMTNIEEERLLTLLVGLDAFEMVFPLLAQLVSLRPRSEAVFRAYMDAALAQSKLLLDRCHWEDAFSLLSNLARRLDSDPERVDFMARIAVYNMQGTAAVMLQDQEQAVLAFLQARDCLQREEKKRLAPEQQRRLFSDRGIYLGAWIEQNLALAHELLGRLDRAEPHWNRYFDLLEIYFSISSPPTYLPRLAYEGLSRLAESYIKKDKGTAALVFLQRAARICPNETDVLERLFHLYAQLRRFEDARRSLRRLREIRPNDPHVDLFELEVRETRRPDEIERLLADLRKVMLKYSDDPRVRDRAATVVHNLVPTIERLGDQANEKLNKILEQMRRLPSYQVNWHIVRDVMRDLEDRFSYLRQLGQRALAFATSEDLRRDLQAFLQHCDRKIEQCHALTE